MKVKTSLTVQPGRNCISFLLIKTDMAKEDINTKIYPEEVNRNLTALLSHLEKDASETFFEG